MALTKNLLLAVTAATFAVSSVAFAADTKPTTHKPVHHARHAHKPAAKPAAAPATEAPAM